MSCCGQHRNTLPAQVSGTTAPAPVPTTPDVFQHGTASVAAMAAGGSVTLRYRQHIRIQVRGPITGRSYAFIPAHPTLVDVRDAAVLLQSRQFLRAMAQPR
jgi:hypothetical protein